VVEIEFHIGQRISYLRKINQISQKELSDKLFISQSQISNYEKNRSELNEELIILLSNIFKVPKDYFVLKNNDELLKTQLEETFNKLLMNKSSEITIFDDEYAIFSMKIEQEVIYRLLRASFYLKKNNYDKIIEDVKYFVPTFEKKITKYRTNSLLLKSYYFYHYQLNFWKNNLNECLKSCYKLEKIFTNRNEIARINITMAQCHYLNNNVNDGLRQINKAISLSNEINDEHLLSIAYTILSAIYIRFKLFNDALKILNKLEALNSKLGNDNTQAIIFSQRGYIYEKKRDYKEAINNYKSSLPLAKDQNNQNKTFIALIISSLKLKDFTLATFYIEELKKRKTKELDKMTLMSLECELQLELGNEKYLRDNLKLFLTYFEDNNCQFDLYYIYTYLAKYYSRIKQYKKVNEYFIKREKLNYEVT